MTPASWRAWLQWPGLARCFPTQAWYADWLGCYEAQALRHGRTIAHQQRSLEHWIDQAIRARGERDKAEEERNQARACLVQAMAEKEDTLGRILYLEGEQRDLERSREELIGIADGLRDELRALRAAVSIGAAHKKRR